jgi:hypothetical protein
MGVSMGAYGREMGLNLLSMGGREVRVHGADSHGNSHGTANKTNINRPVTCISYVELLRIFRYSGYRLYALRWFKGD